MLPLIRKIQPASFFVVTALVLGGIYFIVRPPMQSPDEFNHFLRAYQISEGHFLPEKKDQRLGGEIPSCLFEFLSLYRPSTMLSGYKITRKEILEGFEIKYSDSARVFTDFPNTSYYSPVSYLPQALTLFILRKLHCSVGMLYHIPRLMMFLLWVLSMYFVIRMTPLCKWLFATLLLLPMSLYISVSYSADTGTNILTLLLIAYVLKLAYETEPLRFKALGLLTVIGLLLALTKIVYIGLLPLLLIIPTANFGSRKRKYLFVVMISLLSFSVAYLWSDNIMQYYISYENYNEKMRVYATIHHEADYYKQMQHLKENKLHFFKVLYNSIVSDPKFYLLSYVGHFGTYMNTPLPFWFLVVALSVIFLIVLVEPAGMKLSWRIKLVLLSAALITYALLVLSQHLTWNKPGRDNIESFQGRYLVPVLPLILMLFHASWSRIKFNPVLLVILFVFPANMYASYVLYDFYYVESYVSRVEFSCDVEALDERGRLRTSDPVIRLEGGERRSMLKHHSGKYALLLPPDSAKAAVYHFKDLRIGDLVNIWAWKKGEGGEIVVTGRGLRCEPYHFVNKDNQFSDKQGWTRMQMTFSMFLDCDSSEVSFYVENTTEDTVYFDDLSYSVRKFR